MFMPLGPLINAGSIVAGALLGIALGARLPERMRTIVFQGLGLCTLVIGMQMAFKTAAPVILIFSILIGGISGEEAMNRDFSVPSKELLLGLIGKYSLLPGQWNSPVSELLEFLEEENSRKKDHPLAV